MQISCFWKGQILFCQKKYCNSKLKFLEDAIIKILEFLIHNLFVIFVGHAFQQTISIPMTTICAPILANLFLHLHKAGFMQGLWDNAGDYINRIYLVELKIKDTTDTDRSAFIHGEQQLEIYSEGLRERNITTKEDISVFSLCTFRLYVAKFQHHMQYISLCDITEFCSSFYRNLIFFAH